MKKIPLLIVDVQNGFLNETSELVLTPIAGLVAEWHERGWPIYATRFHNVPGGQWERLIGWTRLQSAPDDLLHEDLAGLLTEHDTIVDKHSYTSLTGRFLTDLEAQDWDIVALCGIATDGCVLKSAVDLFEFSQRPIRPVVLQDACSSHAGKAIHEAGLLLTRRFIGRGQVMDVSDFFAEVDRAEKTQRR